jgi:hypothetical protein
MDLDFAAQLMKLWPLVLGFITLVIVLAKMHATIQVLEEKVKVAFQLINKLTDKKINNFHGKYQSNITYIGIGFFLLANLQILQ